MKVLYLAMVVMLLVVTAMADPGCKGRLHCKHLGGFCGKSCKGYYTYCSCDCNRQGLFCCVAGKKV